MDRDHQSTRPGHRPAVQLAAAIAVHDGHVLIVQRSMRERFLPGVWAVPCGKVDRGESLREAVLRELREETGLDGEVIRFVGKTFFDSDWHGQQVVNEQSNFLVRPKGRSGVPDAPPEVSLPETDQDYKWVATGKIESVGLDEHNLATIRQGLGQDTLSHPASASRTASSRRR
jgi:8-oxo-dGTP diphosphatase